ncbi:MAG: hypothetical protein U0797_30280 [Gemmataceae bacterium]
MRRRHRPGQHLHERGRLALRLGRTAEMVRQASPSTYLQGEVRQAVARAAVVDLHDVRVTQPADCLPLGPEPRDLAHVGVALGQ